MSPERPRRSVAQLRDSYTETVDAIGRQFAQLEIAAAQFDPDLDEQALVSAWSSDDPVERNTVGLLIGNFEKTYMLLMDLIVLSVKLAKKLGAVEDSNVSPLDFIRDRQVISGDAHAAIDDQRQVRNASQHVYVELSMSALRRAVLRQIETTPRVIRDVAAWVQSFEEKKEDRGE